MKEQVITGQVTALSGQGSLGFEAIERMTRRMVHVARKATAWLNCAAENPECCTSMPDFIGTHNGRLYITYPEEKEYDILTFCSFLSAQGPVVNSDHTSSSRRIIIPIHMFEDFKRSSALCLNKLSVAQKVSELIPAWEKYQKSLAKPTGFISSRGGDIDKVLQNIPFEEVGAVVYHEKAIRLFINNAPSELWDIVAKYEPKELVAFYDQQKKHLNIEFAQDKDGKIVKTDHLILSLVRHPAGGAYQDECASRMSNYLSTRVRQAGGAIGIVENLEMDKLRVTNMIEAIDHTQSCPMATGQILCQNCSVSAVTKFFALSHNCEFKDDTAHATYATELKYGPLETPRFWPSIKDIRNRPRPYEVNAENQTAHWINAQFDHVVSNAVVHKDPGDINCAWIWIEHPWFNIKRKDEVMQLLRHKLRKCTFKLAYCNFSDVKLQEGSTIAITNTAIQIQLYRDD